MVGRRVERREVVVVELHLGPLGEPVARARRRCRWSASTTWEMMCSCPGARRRPGSVTSTASAARRASSADAESAARRASSAAVSVSRTSLAALPTAGRSSAESVAEAAQDLGELALLAQVARRARRRARRRPSPRPTAAQRRRQHRVESVGRLRHGASLASGRVFDEKRPALSSLASMLGRRPASAIPPCLPAGHPHGPLCASDGPTGRRGAGPVGPDVPITWGPRLAYSRAARVSGRG